MDYVKLKKEIKSVIEEVNSELYEEWLSDRSIEKITNKLLLVFMEARAEDIEAKDLWKEEI